MGRPVVRWSTRSGRPQALEHPRSAFPMASPLWAAVSAFPTPQTLGIHLPNAPEYIIAFNAAAVAGGRVTTSSPLATASELGYQLRDASASTVLTLSAFRQTVEAAAAESGCVKRILCLDEESGSIFHEDKGVEAWRADGVTPQDCFALPYSSGTTGLPKGTMLSHRNLVANIAQCTGQAEHNLDMTADDVVLGVLPAYHIYAMTVVCKAALRVGATVAMLPKFEAPTFLAAIQEHRVTWAPLVPPLVHFLAKHPAVEAADLSSLRIIFSGAAPLDAGMQSAVEARFPGLSVRQGYGMTELSPICHFAHKDHNKPGSIGFLAPSCEARLVDPETTDDVPEGEEGELCVRGPNVMLGYLNNPKATRDCMLTGGFLRTGDIAHVAADGQWTIRDRLKELIKVKGFQVAPAELEGILMGIDGVADTAVIAIPHDRDGERPKAFVVRSESPAGEALDVDAIKEAVKAVVSDYKQIEEVAFVDAIPKSAAGKILRRLLRDAR